MCKRNCADDGLGCRRRRACVQRAIDVPCRQATPVPTPKEILDDALDQLASTITFVSVGGTSHTLVTAAGLDDPAIPPALARYAVGVLAGWVQYDATIAARFAVRGVEHRSEIQRLVDRITVPKADATTEELARWRQTWRDPWIAEVLTHSLLIITRSRPTEIVTGSVVAVLPPHPIPKRHGLDALAVYDENSVAVMAIGETKASQTNPGAQLTVACDSFDKVEDGLSAPDLRDALKTLAAYIPHELAAQISEELWRDQRCYVPAIVHETEFDGAANRPRLQQLIPTIERKRLLVLRISAFRRFFDDVATAMAVAVDELIT